MWSDWAIKIALYEWIILLLYAEQEHKRSCWWQMTISVSEIDSSNLDFKPLIGF